MVGPDRITYVGHATVLVELDGVRLLTDPVLRGRVAHLRRHGAPPGPDVALELDAVLLSHLHLDHLDLPSLRRLGRDVRVLAPPGSGRLLRRAGFPEVTELAVGASESVGAVTVRAVPAVHDGRRRPFGITAEAIGFEITGGRRIYFAGDTDIFPEMAELAGHLDVALLPVWGWGPSLGPGHLDPARAAEAAAILRPRLAVPIHWGTFFPLGPGRWGAKHLRRPPRDFAAQVAVRAPDVAVRVLEPGASLALA